LRTPFLSRVLYGIGEKLLGVFRGFADRGRQDVAGVVVSGYLRRPPVWSEKLLGAPS